MISDKKAIEAAEIIVRFCWEQKGCQNCIFREYGSDHWKCVIGSFELRDVLGNMAAKRKNKGCI